MENNARQPYTFDRVVRIVIALVIVVGIILLLNRLKGVLLPFLVAWLIAYMMNPLVEWNARIMRLPKRILAIFVTFIEIAIALTLIGLLVVPMIVNETQHLYHLLTVYVNSSKNIPFLPVALQDFLRQHITLERLSTLLSHDQWMELGENAAKQLRNILTTSVHGIATLISWSIVLLYIVFILQDYDSIIKGFGRLIPHRYRNIVSRIGNDVKESMNKHFRGQALIAGITGVLHCIGFLIIGLPMAIPLGILVGLLNMIPYMQILSYIPAAILCIIAAADGGGNFWLMAGLTTAVFVIAQIIQDGFLTPRIMGSVTGLNPAIILLSLSIWSSLLGFVGLIVALPLTTLLLSYYQRYIIEQGNTKENTDITTTKQDS